MDKKEQYKSLTSEIIAKQAAILGPEMAVLKARGVRNLKVSDKGKVVEIKGRPEEALQKLVDEYVNLSGMIVKNALGSVFSKYPALKNNINNIK